MMRIKSMVMRRRMRMIIMMDTGLELSKFRGTAIVDFGFDHF